MEQIGPGARGRAVADVQTRLTALGFPVGAAAMLATPYRRLVTLWGGLQPAERLQALAWVPVIRVAGDVAKMLGYPAGWAWRLAHRASPELYWREAAKRGT